MITRANELRHRLRFRLWTAYLRAQLARRGARLEVEAPHGARMDSYPHVSVEGAGGTLVLRLGRGVKLGRATHLDLRGGENRLELGDGVYFQHGVRVELRGGSVRLGDGSFLRDGTVLKVSGALDVGREVTISYGVLIAASERIELADHVGIGERVSITDSDHVQDLSGTPWNRQPLRTSPVRLERNALVSGNVTILRGARLGASCVVAAGAVVRAGEHAGGWVHAGVPARPLRELGSG